MINTFIALCLLGSAQALRLSGNRACVNVSTQDDFNATQYLGRWYEAESYGWPFGFEVKCVTVDYNLVEDRGSKVVNATILGREPNFIGSLNVSNATEPAKHEITFYAVNSSDQQWWAGKKFNSSYWVLETDYDSFSVVYGCKTLGPSLILEYAWIFTRDRHPSREVVADARKVIKKNKINQQYLFRSDQEGCDST